MVRWGRLGLVVWTSLGLACAPGPSGGGSTSSSGGTSGSATDGGTADAAALDAGGTDAARPQDGGGGPEDAGTPDGGTPRLGTAESLADTLCGDIQGGLCAAGARCGCITPQGPALDPTECALRQDMRCRAQLEPVLAGVGAGTIVALADNLAACAAASARAVETCQGPRNTWLRSVCDVVISTTVALGAPCSEPICAYGQGQCVEGICVPVPAAGGPCQGLCQGGHQCVEGTCRAEAPLGGACSDTAPCSAGVECVMGTCRALLALGSPCTLEAQCAAGLLCTSGVCAEPTAECTQQGAACGNLAACAIPQTRACAPNVAADGACTQDGQCQSGLYCDSAETLCRAPPANGSACGNGVECGAGSGCNPDTTTCAALPTTGQACALGNMGPFLCAEGLACLNGICGAIPGQGQACALPNVCGAGLGCDFTPEGSFCVPKRPAGEPCASDLVCADGTFCNFSSGRCATFLPTGSPCSAGNECGPQGSCMTDGTAFTCRPMPQSGEPCFLDCAAGTYCASTPLPGACHPEVCVALVGGG